MPRDQQRLVCALRQASSICAGGVHSQAVTAIPAAASLITSSDTRTGPGHLRFANERGVYALAQDDSKAKMLLLLGEVGGLDEYDLIEAQLRG